MPSARATLVFLWADEAADVGVLEVDTSAEDVGKGDGRDEENEDGEGVEEAAVTTNKSGL
jgi:hypothetical protein